MRRSKPSTFGTLRLKFPDGKKQKLTINKGEFTIGRTSDSDIVVDHPTVSRAHARLLVTDDGVQLEDLDSANGTFLDDERLAPNEPIELQAKQQLLLGSVGLRYQKPLLLTIPLITAGVIGVLAVLALCVGSAVAIANNFRQRPLDAFSVCEEPAMLVLTKGGQIALTQGGQPVITAPAATLPSTTAPMPTNTFAPGETPILLTPTDILPTSPPSREIVSLAFMELPFPYDGGNENFGGTLEQFKRANQRSSMGGRINSFFDHFLPLYPGSADPSIPGGKEPIEEPIGGFILLYTGELSNLDNYSGHPALDYSTFVRREPTTPVFAVADGVITSVGEHSSGALFVRIVHSVPGVGNFQTTSWHLHPDEYFDAMLGTEGQSITAGTRIGTMGNTGWSTGHHLHFEVRFDRNGNGAYSPEEAVDPYGFIPSSEYPSDPWLERTGLVSQYLWIHPLGVVAEVPEDGSGAVSSDDGVGGIGFEEEQEDAQGLSLCGQSGSFPPGGKVHLSWIPDPIIPGGVAGAGQACSLTVFDAQGVPVTSFDPPVRVTIPFNEADLAILDPDTLAIYRREPGSDAWTPLPTSLDRDAGLAVAFFDKPGQCALLGTGISDRFAPTTLIDISGVQSEEGAWYDSVTVTLGSADTSGIEKIEYSLDAGATWQEYTGPFTFEPSGIPLEAVEMEGEFFGFGPGMNLILASTTDGAGNVEDPPAFRMIVIDPSKDPDYQEPTDEPTPEDATPTMTPTLPTPTLTSTLDASCSPTLTVDQNAFCREGPGGGFDEKRTFLTGQSLMMLGQTAEGQIKWWQVQIPDSSQSCWMSDSVVTAPLETSCLPVIFVATITPTPSPTLATPPTPTETPVGVISPTPTRTPTQTPSKTPTPSDQTPPPAPALYGPIDDDVLYCESQTSLDWYAVSDSSGINYYEWVLESSPDAEGYFFHSSGTTGYLYGIANVNCGTWYRWKVRAVDGAGNFGPYSPYGYFSVGID